MSSPAPINNSSKPLPVDAAASSQQPATVSTTTTKQQPPPPPPRDVSSSTRARNMQNKLGGKMI